MRGRRGVLLLCLFVTGLLSGCDSPAAKVAKPKPLPTEPGPVDNDAPKEFSVTESGLKYRILRKSTGKKPTLANNVQINCRGWLNGDTDSMFETTYGTAGSPRFVELRSQGIRGFVEGLQLIGEGGMIELEIPPNLAYGKQGYSGIPADCTLNYLIELIAVLDPPPPPEQPPSTPSSTDAPSQPDKVDSDAPTEFTTTASGLKYRIRRKSDGRKATATGGVKVHYRGWLDNGIEFDSTYAKNQPEMFRLIGLIKGWTEGMQLIGIGGMIELEVPPELGYGADAKPKIPANSTLHFLVEVIDVR